jgi:hypothetical protein
MKRMGIDHLPYAIGILLGLLIKVPQEQEHARNIGYLEATCFDSFRDANPSCSRKMTLNEDRLFCASAARLALRGDGFACLSGAAHTWSPLFLLNPVLVLSCCCRQYSPSRDSECMLPSSFSIVASFLASSAPC